MQAFEVGDIFEDVDGRFREVTAKTVRNGVLYVFWKRPDSRRRQKSSAKAWGMFLAEARKVFPLDQEHQEMTAEVETTAAKAAAAVMAYRDNRESLEVVILAVESYAAACTRKGVAIAEDRIRRKMLRLRAKEKAEARKGKTFSVKRNTEAIRALANMSYADFMAKANGSAQ